jgi:CHAT domain-containing protein/Tfp pilus assembly protein PilF
MAHYNEGARLYQEKDFQQAREKYQAALDQAQALGDIPGIGFSLAAIGAAQQSLKEYDQAVESFKSALPYLKASRNVAAEALTFAAVGEVQIQLGYDARAIEAFHQALTIAETLLKKASDSDPDKLLIFSHREKVLFRQAQAYERLGNHTEAVKSYQAAAADSQKTGNVDLAGAALWGAGLDLEKIGDLEQAITLYTEASSLLERAGKIKEANFVKLELGRVQLQLGKIKDSIGTFMEVSEAAEQQGLPELAAEARFWLGDAFERLSDFENALANYRSGLRQLRAGDWKDKTKLEADTLLHMGVIHRWLSQYEEAIELLRMAALKYQEADNATGQANSFAQLAEIFSWIDEPKTAVTYYKDALDIYKKIGDLPRQINALAALGEAGYLTDEVSIEDGERYFKDGQQLVGSLSESDPYFRVRTVEKGKTLSTEQLKKILEEWREKLPTLKTEDRKAAGILYQKWGRTALDSKNLKAAAGMLLHAFEYHSILPLLRLAQINREVAIELAKDAYFLGEAFRQLRSTEGALKYFRIVEQIASRLRTPEIHFAYTGLARAYTDLGDTDKALEYYKKGIAVLESVQGQQGTEDIKIGVFAGALYSYGGFLRVLLDVYTQTKEQRYLDESFEYNERMKARVFVEMLARSQRTRASDATRSKSPPHEEIRRKIAQIHHRLQTPKLEQSEETKLLDQLESLRQVWRSLQKEMTRQDPRHSRGFSSQPTTVASVQAALDADAVLLEYATAYDGSILWAITKEQIKAYKLPGGDVEATLESYLTTLRQPLIGADEISSHIELGQKLYRELLGPAEEIIRRKKHLVIAPDGPLHYLPFEALIISQGQSGSRRRTKLSDVEYLLKQYRVTYIPSASVLVAQRGARQTNFTTARQPLLAFGDPVYREASNSQTSDDLTAKVTNLALRGQDFRRLEFSGDEVRRIARVWGVSPDSQHVHLREKATVERVRSLDLSQYRILHFAAHAILGDQVKTLSQPALVLSQLEQANIEEGLLQFSDILELKLNADLVVLSACETGLGKLRDGEGIVGLTRAFIYAGASSAVVSLWKVEDQSTSLLMERFYEKLKRGLSKYEALRQAKLDIMRSTVELKATGMHQDLASPFYWAPFILVGDWGPIQTN